jgi:hypothetical protein
LKPRASLAQRWTVGAIVQISLDDGYFAYAQMLEQPEYAFFGVRTPDELSADAVVQAPVLFRLWVMRYAHSKGRWRKVGAGRIGDALRKPVHRYNQDPFSRKIRLTINGVDGPEGTIADCDDLECAAVWDPEHVEDRLRDHFLGIPNKWVLSLRPKTAG